MLPRMAALDSDVTAALAPAPSVAVKKEGLSAVPVFPASLVAMKTTTAAMKMSLVAMKTTTAAMKMNKTTAAMKMNKTTAAMKMKKTTAQMKMKRWWAVKKTTAAIKETTEVMKETTAAMKETMATIQKSLAGKLETTTAMKMKSVLFPTLYGFVSTFTELVRNDYPHIANIEQLLSNAREICLNAMNNEMFWKMVEQDICRTDGFSDDVLGEENFTTRFSEVSLKLVVTSLGVAYKLWESGIHDAHIFYCILLGVDYDFNENNLFHAFKLHCFTSDANMVIVHNFPEAHYSYIDVSYLGGILPPTDQVPMRSVPAVMQYGVRVVSKMNEPTNNTGNGTFRYTASAVKPEACKAFETFLFPFVFGQQFSY